MKPTDEERREVAKRLRVLASHREVDKEMFHDAIGVWPGGCIDGYDPVGVMELADLIEPKPEQTFRWVSVEERLPESAGEYIVAYHPCYCACVNEAVTLIGMDSFRGKTAWSKRKYQRVTHWMPKPELPKVVEE